MSTPKTAKNSLRKLCAWLFSSNASFQRFRFYNLEKDNALTEFALKDLRKYVMLFGYMIGAGDVGEIREQDPVNRKAAEKMARLHDAMKAVG